MSVMTYVGAAADRGLEEAEPDDEAAERADREQLEELNRGPAFQSAGAAQVSRAARSHADGIARATRLRSPREDQKPSEP